MPKTTVLPNGDKVVSSEVYPYMAKFIDLSITSVTVPFQHSKKLIDTFIFESPKIDHFITVQQMTEPGTIPIKVIYNNYTIKEVSIVRKPRTRLGLIKYVKR